MGINVLEVENHAAQLSLEDMQREVYRLKNEGFKVVGEVGAKWAHQDDTRITRDRADVTKVVSKMKALLEAGADHLYWEGMVVRSLLGNQLENSEGQKQVLEVAQAVGLDKIIFEMWNARGGGYGGGNTPQWGWLIHKFGPEVNIANCPITEISLLEEMRRGMGYDPDHPYLRWLSSGRPTENWWEVESPDYSVDIQPQ